MRKKHKAFFAEADTWLIPTGNDCVVVFGRYYENEKVICIFNYSNMQQRIYTSEEETYKDLFTNKTEKIDCLDLRPYEFRWLGIKYK